MDANLHDCLSDEPGSGPQGSWMPDNWTAFSNTSAPQQVLVAQSEWPPSPPSLHGEDLSNYSFQAPYDLMSGSPPAPSGYNPSTLSPRGWPQDTAAVWNDSLATHPSQQPGGVPQENTFSSHDQSSRRGSPTMLAEAVTDWSMSPADSHRGSLSPSDSQYAAQEDDYAVKAEDATVLAGNGTAVKAEDECGGGLTDKTMARQDEPYAQLIYRALLSRPGHSMTLQEIYQWFRENTDKIKGMDKATGKENKGWQNSIRHNLSMNMAFGKRDPPEWNVNSPPSPGKAKKSTEWILQPWAVTEGVESTTRYRKNDGARRARMSPARGSMSPVRRNRHQAFYPHPINPGQTIPGRAKSGRLGGRAAARQVALRQATLMNGQGATAASSSPFTSYPAVVYEPVPALPMHYGHHLYHQPQAYEFPNHPFPASVQQQFEQQQLYHQHHQHHITHDLEMPLASDAAPPQGGAPAEAALAFPQQHNHQPHQQPSFDVGGANLADVRGVYPGDGLGDGESGDFKWCAGYDGISRQ